MVNVPRIHCHSAYKHYHMFHNNSGSSYGNSIFNTTYNFNGGTMCGGGFWGGLLGGFGMGLGAGLMNMFGGFFGGMGFGGGFGFPMGGMFGGGFGFPMFGGGFGNWGGYGGGYRADGAGGKDKKTKEKVVEKEVKNKDTKLIGNYSKEIDVLRDPSKTPSVTKDQLQNLYDKINKSKLEQDDIEKDADSDSYENLLNDLKKIAEKNGLEFKDGKFADKEPAPTPTQEQPETPQPSPAPTQNPPVVHEERPAEVDVNSLNLNNPQQIIDNIDKITSSDQAITILGNRVGGQKPNQYVKVPRNYAELLLAQKSGLKIQFCKNNGLKGKNQSQTISGKIEKIEEKDGKYLVTVKDTGTHVLSFDFKSNTEDDPTIVTLVSSVGASVNGYKLNDVTDGTTQYMIKDDNNEWAERDNKNPAISGKAS